VYLRAGAGQASVATAKRPSNLVKSSILHPSVASFGGIWKSAVETIVKLPDMLRNLKGVVLESPKSAAISLVKGCAALGFVSATLDEGFRRSVYFWTNAFPVYLHYKFVNCSCPFACFGREYGSFD
jgi:hypothetical protein